MKELDEFIRELESLGVSNEIIGKALIKTATKYAISIDNRLKSIDERLGRIDHPSKQLQYWYVDDFPPSTEYIKTTI